MSRAPHLTIEHIAKSFGPSPVLDGISLEVAAGEFLALIGPSGCGKSTLLRIMSGLERADSGRVILAGRDVTLTRAAERDVAMVFQSYALYPHLTARQNMTVPLAMRRLTALQRTPLLNRLVGGREAARAIAAEVEATAAALKITPLLDRKPAQMSGGQRQRVALGRAIVRHPQAFLMDEPLSNLDASLRVHMRGEIVDLHRRLGTTTIYVTHDQEEALSMADRIAVMMNGRLLQVDRPEIIYRDPNHLDVAEFVGSPKINVVAAEIDAHGMVRRDGVALAEGYGAAAGAAIRLAVRPEHLTIEEDAQSGALPARLVRLEFQGSAVLAHLALANGDRLVGRMPERVNRDEARPLYVRAAPQSWLAFDGTGSRLRPVAAVFDVAEHRALAHG
jgi:multiple sugar transport system ATP-binding protein